MTGFLDLGLEVFSTCPQSKEFASDAFVPRASAVARWSEAAGCTGILVYADNSLADPWLVAEVVLRATERLCPLVALQPVYMHPFAAAKMVSSIGFLHGRRVCLNLIAGGFKNDLVALHDRTPHDDRYVRLTEYCEILLGLLRGGGPFNYAGRYYTVQDLRLAPPLPDALFPGVLISGSSEEGLAAARRLGATAVKYPAPPSEETAPAAQGVERAGIRVGVIAREDGGEAWRVARERFPDDRIGRATHQLAMKVSDSSWHHQLSSMAKAAKSGDDDPYWLGPFQNYRTFCPYLVGSYDRVAREIARYLAAGFRTFILDIPPSEDEMFHIVEAFRRALRAAS